MGSAWLAGYEGALPVRIGNAAHAQLQLDVYGELIDAFHQSRIAELKLDDAPGRWNGTVLNHLAEVWDQPDHGIWERRGDGQALRLSKVMTWVAFDGGNQERGKIRLQGAAGEMADVARHHPSRRLRPWFRRQAECVRRILRIAIAGRQHSDVAGGRLSAGVGSTCAGDAGSDRKAHDARRLRAAARPARNLRGKSSRSKARFSPAACGSPTPMCWPARSTERKALFDRVVGIANDLGLLAEEYDSGEKRQTGNFPQALTHIALINTAHNLSDAKRPVEKPVMQRAK